MWRNGTESSRGDETTMQSCSRPGAVLLAVEQAQAICGVYLKCGSCQ